MVVCRQWRWQWQLFVDDDYVKFVEKLENVEPEVIPTPEVFLEEIEAREKQMKGPRHMSE